MKRLFSILIILSFLLTSCSSTKVIETPQESKNNNINITKLENPNDIITGRLLFSLQNSNIDFDVSLYTTDIFGKTYHKLDSDFLKGKRIGYYSISHDGNFIIVGIHYDAAAFQYYLIDGNGNNPVQLTIPIMDGVNPTFSRDGKYVYGISRNKLNDLTGFAFKYDIRNKSFKKIALKDDIRTYNNITQGPGDSILSSNRAGVKLLDFENGTEKQIFKSQSSDIFAYYFDKQIVVISDRFGTVDYIDGNTLKTIKTENNSLKYKLLPLHEIQSPDGNYVVFYANKYDNKDNFIGQAIIITNKKMINEGLKESDNIIYGSLNFINNHMLAGITKDKRVIVYDLSKTKGTPYFESPLVNIDKFYVTNLNVKLPYGWTSEKINGTMIKFMNNNKEETGGMFLVGYYKDQPYGGALPNHSQIIKNEDIKTPLGDGKLVVLNRSLPAASNDNGTWNEIYALIPIKDQNFAYSIYVKSNKDIEVDKSILLNIISSIK